MTFTFKVHPTATGDAARVAYYLPELPAGVSYELHQALRKYAEGIRSGPDHMDEIAHAEIRALTARSLPDVIAKVVYQLHYEHRGLSEEGDLVITEQTDADTVAIELAMAVLSELYAQLPQDWQAARRAYHGALVVEHEFDRRVYDPAYEASGDHLAVADYISNEASRLMDLRLVAEEHLLAMAAPTIAEWAIKFLICFDCDRDLNGYTEALCDEARKLLGIAAVRTDDRDDDRAVIEATAAWEA